MGQLRSDAVEDVRTFVAASMPAALALVKRSLGADAVILGTRSIEPSGLRGLVGARRVEITAAASVDSEARSPRVNAAAPATPPSKPAARTAIARREVAPAPRTPAPDIPDLVHPYYLELVQNEVAEDLAASLVRAAAARGATADSALRDYIAAQVPNAGGIKLTRGVTRRVAFVGPSGAGKTSTIAKLAARFQLRERQRVVLVTLDTRRLSAEDQLRRYGEIIGVPVIALRSPEEMSAAQATFEKYDVVLIDTPGVGIRDRDGCRELARQLRCLAPDETHLVVPASLAPVVHSRIAAALTPLGVSHVVLTRLDEAVGFGVILGAMQKLHWRLSYLSSGQSVPNDLVPACSRSVAELIFPPRTTRSSS